MPITVGAKKKLRQDKHRTERNLRFKNTVKATIKAFKKNPSEKSLSAVFRLLDQSEKKNLFHKNKIARLKSTFAHTLQNNSKKTEEKPVKKRSSKTKK